ncbi:ABC transporter substrate-binding protein [Kribbella albertanoniae]|uniref:ABC transporter substrate-binding protein n=1 Tax=Kribbella albertanoniae TaxID=1266829 RepID=A0A4R4PK10_9ACTN|nr:ABC transporter substrate-binding protein [Kribbella albertanoniae]TDC22421.1 ABC transporter substrate-binding protein [Kribbella albertanoniae]
MLKKILVGIALLSLAACADPVAEAPPSDASAVSFDTSGKQAHITSTKVDAIAAELPEAVKASGKLVIGNGSAGGGQPPLGFTADDNKTPIGVEIDIAHLVASVLGLQAEVQTTSWENLFLGLDSGKYQVGISNIGVSELRKEKYDFATYRLGLHAFEAKTGSGLKIAGPADISGKKVAVSSGTLQEAILLEWNKQNAAAGRPPADLKYYQQSADTFLALQSGRIDLYLGPNPNATYHVATQHKTEIVGTVSSGYPIQGLVGITTKKDNGLVKPLADALNAAIADGSYAKVLAKWGLSDEAVPKSLVNPPGLPKPPAK